MATDTFDTLAAARELQAAGIQAGQAEAIVTAIRQASGEHVTITDLRVELTRLRGHVGTSVTELRTELTELRAHIDTSVTELRTELTELRAHIDTSIAALRGEIYRSLWLQGAAIVGTLTALQLTALQVFLGE